MAEQIKQTALVIAMIVLAVMLFFSFIRALIGPRIADRIVAINMIGTQVILLICILAVYLKEDGLVDMAIIYAMFSFLAVVFFTRIYMGAYNQRVIEKEGGDIHDEFD